MQHYYNLAVLSRDRYKIYVCVCVCVGGGGGNALIFFLAYRGLQVGCHLQNANEMQLNQQCSKL